MFKIIKINRRDPEKQAINTACRYLREGGVVIFPADTVYGLAVDATSQLALKKLFALKKRPREKSVSCIFENLRAIEAVAKITPRDRGYLKKYLPGAFTFILPARDGDGTIGARLPDNKLCQALAQTFQKPITATSANLAGEGEAYSLDDLKKGILKNFGGKARVNTLVLDGGRLPKSQPSTVVDLTTSTAKILRQGRENFTP